MRWLTLLTLLVAACSSKEDPPKSAPPPTKTAATAPAPAHGAPPPIEAAIERANKDHKPLIVEFYTAWCKPCQVFEKSTLTNARVKAALDRITFVRYDAEAAPGTAAAERFHVSSFPTFLVLDKDGVARVTQDGLEGDGVEQFLSLIDAAETTAQSEADLRAQLAAKPHDNALRLKAARWFASRDLVQDALVQLDAVLADRTANAADQQEARLSSTRLRRVAKWRAELVDEKLALARLMPDKISARDLAIATVDSGARARDVHVVMSAVLSMYAEPATINGLLYIALAAGAKDEALDAAKRVLASSKDPNLLDTLAECYHVHGDKAEALRVEDQAIALADKGTASALAANRARFAKGTGDSSEVTRLHAQAHQLAKQLARIEDATSDDAEDRDGGSSPQNAAMNAFMASHKLAATVATACQSSAGKSKRAFARVELDGSGKVTASSVFLDADAAPALRACIAKNLAGATLPVVAGFPTPPLEIDFAPRAAAL